MDARRDSKLELFLKGLVTPIRAVGVILSSSKLIGLSALPILITVIVLSLVFYALMAGLWSWVSTAFTGFLTGYEGGIMVVLGMLAGLVFLYLSIQSMAFITGLFASPFNDILAESAERELGVPEVPGFSFRRAISVFFVDLRKTAVTLAVTLVLALILLIPVVGLVAFLGVALLNTFTFVTYPQSRRHMGVRQSMRWILSHLPSSLGFGMTSALLFAVPVLNLFALPVMVVGGTLLFVEMERHDPSRNRA